jgi:hypothetical protein
VPLLEVKSTALVCISTPLSESNHYSELCNTKDSKGNDVFRTIRVGLVCDACREAGLATTCTHRAADVPNWKSDEGREVVNALYGDRTTLLLRESLGVVCEDANTVFPVAHVSALYARPPVALDGSRVENIFVACDPSGLWDFLLRYARCRTCVSVNHATTLQEAAPASLRACPL